MALLTIRNLSKRFGGLVAVDNVDFDVEQGEIRGLIGPNGAGKTTTFNLISAALPPTSGSIIFKGEQMVGLKPYHIAAKGLVRTFQQTTLFGEATVRQNLITALHMKANVSFLGAVFGGKGVSARETEVQKRADELMELLDLADLRNEVAKSLPHGHQRRLGAAIALATSPEMLLLDEPVTGMTPEETREMMVMIGKVREAGTTILLVEHDMRAVMGICDKITVLNYGRKIAEGTPSEIRENEEVIKAYLGERRVDVT